MCSHIVSLLHSSRQLTQPARGSVHGPDLLRHLDAYFGQPSDSQSLPEPTADHFNASWLNIPFALVCMYLFLIPWHLTKPAEELVHGLSSHINPRPCCSSAFSLQAVPVLFKACSLRTRIASPVYAHCGLTNTQGNEKV